MLEDLERFAAGIRASWTLENPDSIRELSAAYVAAGSDHAWTNTFGGNHPFGAFRYSLGDKPITLRNSREKYNASLTPTSTATRLTGHSVASSRSHARRIFSRRK